MDRFMLRTGDARTPYNFGEAAIITNEGSGVVFYADDNVVAAEGSILPGATTVLAGVQYLWTTTETQVRLNPQTEVSLPAAVGRITATETRLDSVESGQLPKTLLDAKGDLIAASAADTAARVAAGADGTILTADAASAAGVKWGPSVAPPPGGYVPGTTKTRRAQFALGGGGFLAGFDVSVFTDAHQRVPFRVPVQSTRFKVKIRNIGADGVVGSGAFAMTGLWLGTPTVASDGTYPGPFTGPAVQIASAFTLTDGVEYDSGWITGATQLTGLEQSLSMGWTAPAGSLMSKGAGLLHYGFGAGSSSQASAAAPTGNFGIGGSLFFDIRIEYEFEGSNLVGIAIGDSLTEGYYDSPGLPSHWSWQHRFGQRVGIPMCTSAAQGTNTSLWTNPSTWKWSRWNASGLTIDFAIVFVMGANDVNSYATLTLAQTQANVRTIVANLRALGIQRVYLATTAPMPNNPHVYLNADFAIGANSFTADKALGGNIANGEVITLGSGAGRETLTVNTVTGTAPVTITTTGVSAKAHAKGEVIAGVRESRRYDINQFLMNGPAGSDGTFDFAAVVADRADPAVCDPVMVGVDKLHFSPYGYQKLAAAVTGPLVRS